MFAGRNPRDRMIRQIVEVERRDTGYVYDIDTNELSLVVEDEPQHSSTGRGSRR